MPCPLSSKTQPDSRGLGPATHVFATRCSKRKDGVDGRDKPGRRGISHCVEIVAYNHFR
jgi:hypothetical protein